MYEKYLSINKKFKSSVNLQYDINNEDKIEQYVPTTDLCDVIKQYVSAVLNNDNKATFLAGPYGKGKSYLILMITYIFSKRENRVLFNKLLNKISLIDSELANMIGEIDSRDISLLPVVINNNSFDDLNQNFMLALKNSLVDNGLDFIIPKSTYNECLEMIKKWENDKNNGFNILKECSKTLKINLDELKVGLSDYETKYYKKFEDLFSCISHGCKFYPLISNDFSEIFYDVTKQICEYGYNGIFVIFDEFGVFLENQFGDFAKRLNKIQSFAEKCQSSEMDNQMHICCITHKDISLYNKEKDFKDDFEKISGRFKQFRFDRSLDENYQIICSAISKKEGYKELCKKMFDTNNDIISKMFDSNIFSSQDQLSYILNNAIPFNPLSLYALIRVSEKIAQNERTLFTFLSDTDVNSFNYFISNNENNFLNVSTIYDYFEQLIKDNKDYKDLYFKVESSKRMSVKSEEHLILKSLAVFKIINDEVKFNSTIENIALSLMKDVSEVRLLINKLISKNILRQNINDNSIDFSVIPGSEINKLLEDVIATKLSSIDLSDLLVMFDKNKYFISNKYNFEYKMTRFYKSIYIENSKFINLSNLNNLNNDEECDGLLINLINDASLRKDDILSLLKKNDGNIIVRFGKNPINKNIIEKLKKLYAAQLVLKSDKKLSDDLKNALPLYIEDLCEEINIYLVEYNKNTYCLNKYDFSINNISDCIYNSFVNFYSQTVILNNEQINKNIVSSVTLKSRNMIIDSILTNQDMSIYGTTSAEATILNSFNLSKNRHSFIVDYIRNWFINSCGQKRTANDLIKNLKSNPFGMRNGVIPLYIAYVISLISSNDKNNVETVLMYNDKSEIELNAINLSKMMDNPSKFYFYFKNISKSKIVVVENLLRYLNVNPDVSFSANIKLVVKMLKLKVSNLPPIVIKTNVKDDLIILDKKIIAFKDLLLKHDLNNYDVVFEDLPNILNTTFEDLCEAIKESFENIDTVVNNFYLNVIGKTLDSFGDKSTTIKSTFDLWVSRYGYADDIVFEQKENRLYKTFKSIMYNDLDSINMLSSSILGCTLDDWNKMKKDNYFSVLNEMISKVENYDTTKTVIKFEEKVDDAKISNLGKTLYSNLSESIDEYGSALSNEEKLMILKKLMNDILN